jgi:hypothetical protein
MARDLFDFMPEEAVADDEFERPKEGEDDPALMAPVLAALKTVRDPEIPMDLVELGLIYELIVKKGGTVYVEMKNAILIVEFARQRQDVDGDQPEEAATSAARTRLRPILMTSFAFILGVFPLAVATGAGSEMRQSLGTAVLFGMLGVTRCTGRCSMRVFSITGGHYR